jgi:hypothetical protein
MQREPKNSHSSLSLSQVKANPQAKCQRKREKKAKRSCCHKRHVRAPVPMIFNLSYTQHDQMQKPQISKENEQKPKVEEMRKEKKKKLPQSSFPHQILHAPKP